jgi:hypothetical protein
MKEEYMKTHHFKKKIEDFKINKIMGRIKKHAKGPNPLSVKKKKERKDYEGKEINTNEVPVQNDNNMENGQENTSKKRERKRYKKVKNSQ